MVERERERDTSKSTRKSTSNELIFCTKEQLHCLRAYTLIFESFCVSLFSLEIQAILWKKYLITILFLMHEARIPLLMIRDQETNICEGNEKESIFVTMPSHC